MDHSVEYEPIQPWRVAAMIATGNAPSSFSRSVVMFRPGYKPAARRLANDIGIKRVIPLDGITKGDLQGAQLALIIGG